MRTRYTRYTALIAVLGLLGLLAACRPAEVDTDGGDGAKPVVIDWHREGGIAGFCDSLTVTEDTATATPCDGQPVQIELTAEQAGQVRDWAATLASFTYTSDDGPDVADRMVITLTFTGRGSTVATDVDFQAIQDFASQVYLSAAASE
jgi:hypothetical protein